METNESILLEPSAKKNVQFSREYPFPIIQKADLDGAVSSENWNCIVGHLSQDCVYVTDVENMKMLFMMGFFGKGTLSKSAPKVCNKSGRDVRSDINSCEEDSLGTKENTSERKAEVVELQISDSDDDNLLKNKIENEPEIVCINKSCEISDTNIELSDSVEEEKLQLTFEEAFFLSYGLGCLIVKDKDQPLNLIRLWQKLCDLSPEQNFPIMYTAYHHFRSKGWIVRSGLKYGTDYILYKDGPPFYHSTYAVIVKSVNEQNFQETNKGGRQPLTWSSLSALNRVCAHSGKGLMFLYVIKPSTLSELKVSTPLCISQYKVEEVLIKRWVAAENREDM